MKKQNKENKVKGGGTDTTYTGGAIVKATRHDSQGNVVGRVKKKLDLKIKSMQKFKDTFLRNTNRTSQKRSDIGNVLSLHAARDKPNLITRPQPQGRSCGEAVFEKNDIVKPEHDPQKAGYGSFT